MAVAFYLAHTKSPPKTFGRLTVTRDVRNLIRQASQVVMTTSVESTCHRLLSRIRKGEIIASDFGLASLRDPLILCDGKGFGDYTRLLQDFGVLFHEGPEPVFGHVGDQVVEHAA